MKLSRADITPELLRERLTYCPTTGVFRWRTGTNTGKPAGHIKSGYVRIAIGGVNVFAHRAAWAIAHGKWPDEVVDHINRDRQDNRLENLRDVSGAVNAKNKGKRGRLK